MRGTHFDPIISFFLASWEFESRAHALLGILTGDLRLPIFGMWRTTTVCTVLPKENMPNCQSET